MAFEMTIVKGLTEDAVKRLSTLSSTIEKRFDGVDRRFEQIDTRLDRVEGMLVQILEYLSEKS